MGVRVCLFLDDDWLVVLFGVWVWEVYCIRYVFQWCLSAFVWSWAGMIV